MRENNESSPHPSPRIEQEQSRLLHHALDSAGIGTGDLWLRYFSIGGNAGEYEVDAYIQTILSLPPSERDLLAHAANELIDELPARPRAPYLDELEQSEESAEHPSERSQKHHP